MMLELLKKHGLVIAVTAVAVAAGFFAVRWLASGPPEGIIDVKAMPSMEGAWAEAIKNFGIEPVFPPEEDLAVGDVLAVVVADNDPDDDKASKKVDVRSPFLKRVVRLAHVNVRKQLEETYAMLPVFPAFDGAKVIDKKSPGQDGKSSPQGLSVGRQFTKDVLENNLPRAAFTSLRIQGTNSAAAGLSARGQRVADYGASAQGLETLHLIGVSTYGLPSARALGLLKAYCSDAATKGDCLETTVRNHLQPIIGDRIHSKYVDPQGKDFYPIVVEIVIVNRVYLARSIVHERRADSTQGASVRIMAPRLQDDGKKTDNAPPEQPGSTPRATTGDATTYDALKKRLDEVEKQLARARDGGALSYESSTGREFTLNESLDRPVAFGYRSVRYNFPRDESKDKSQ